MTTRLAVLGDSIAWGQGALHASERPAARWVDGLAQHGVVATARVLAVPGARSADLGQQVDQALRWEPHVAVIVIGANDLTHLEPVEPAVAALEDGVRRLRASRAQVVVAPAPDLSTVPHVPLFLRAFVQSASQDFRSRQVAAVLAAGGRIGDPDERASRAFATDPSLFSVDRFHPSASGYAVIAAALLPAVLTAALRSSHP